MLLEDPRVLDGHQPPGEVDQPRAEGTMTLEQRRGPDRVVVRARHLRHPAPRDRARPSAMPTDRRTRLPSGESLGGALDQPALRLERQHGTRLRHLEPADLVELVIVPAEIPAGRLHQEVEDGLVDPGAALRERVADEIERLEDADLQSGLLGHLADGRLLGRLPRDRRALGEGPGSDVVAPTGDEPRDAGLEPDDDATGGGGGGLLQASHGADAALERPSRTGPLGRDQRIDTIGRIRPLVTGRGWATVIDRQRARTRWSSGGSGWRSTVGRAGVARNVTVARSPSRRSRARDGAPTKRAAGRAA